MSCQDVHQGQQVFREVCKVYNRRWRPIQSFVALSNDLEADHGGFEAAKGFH
eukprot:CAMPEP_0206216252 /NCGR_PEP_ID=MMETSP0047_2-20121206/2622_1 /ASSEMBLY_ACC=CAM_ASM_000192 /TAXON_ID=195065 /ORGANISM="Chroomonas mesostigmatica_cf, Strain CCMP1168" /LENGTH=51 /DNA_ID=CAMNT_0053638587 /DNA_START=156 /DNA_END=308 /DNA_ORIENTATION=-